MRQTLQDQTVQGLIALLSTVSPEQAAAVRDGLPPAVATVFSQQLPRADAGNGHQPVAGPSSAPPDPDLSGDDEPAPAAAQQQPHHQQHVAVEADAYTFENWHQNSTQQLERAYGSASIPFHRDFRVGFGVLDDDSLQTKMGRVLACLRQYKTQCGGLLNPALAANPHTVAPPIAIQPIAIYGPERQGKTSAQFSVQRAALDMGFFVVVFVAPTKVAPVVDMHTKMAASGFTNIQSTVHDNKLPDGVNSDTFRPHILIAAANNPNDVNRAGDFIQAALQARSLVVSIADECDELVMGKGRGQADCQIQEEVDGEIQTITHYDIAKSERLFRERIQPFCQLFLITATQLGTYLKKVPFYIDNVPPVFIRIRKSEQYAGVADIKCHIELPAGTNTTAGNIEKLLCVDEGLDQMLQCFAHRQNEHDNAQLTCSVPEGHPAYKAPIRLEGTLFVSLTCFVAETQPQGAYTLSRSMCRRLRHLAGASRGRPLMICFVGKPMAYTCGDHGEDLSLALKNGMTLLEMVTAAKMKWGDYNFSHTAIIGYNLTRRAMTATYHLDGKLYTPMYGMVAFPKTSKLDSDSQRLLRVGHDFGIYSKPKGYQILLACEAGKLQTLKNYRLCEEEVFCGQEEKPVSMAELKEQIPVREYEIDGHHVTKAKRKIADLGTQEPRAIRGRNHEALSPLFAAYLEDVVHISAATASTGAPSTVQDYTAQLGAIMGNHSLRTILDRNYGRIHFHFTRHTHWSVVQHFRNFWDVYGGTVEPLLEEEDEQTD